MKTEKNHEQPHYNQWCDRGSNRTPRHIKGRSVITCSNVTGARISARTNRQLEVILRKQVTFLTETL